MDSIEVQIARIEGSLVGLHGKFDSHKKAQENIDRKVQEHEKEFVEIHTNNWWIRGIAATAFVTALAAIKIAYKGG